jgi:hypothetical protein
MTPVVEAKCQLTGSIVILAPLTVFAPTADEMELALIALAETVKDDGRTPPLSVEQPVYSVEWRRRRQGLDDPLQCSRRQRTTS